MGTGGIIVNSENPHILLREVTAELKERELLLPRQADTLVDQEYVM